MRDSEAILEQLHQARRELGVIREAEGLDGILRALEASHQHSQTWQTQHPELMQQAHLDIEQALQEAQTEGPMVRLDADVAAWFPDAESVNRALRILALVAQRLHRPAPPGGIG